MKIRINVTVEMFDDMKNKRRQKIKNKIAQIKLETKK